MFPTFPTLQALIIMAYEHRTPCRETENLLVCTRTGISPGNVLARHASDICWCGDGGYVRITRRLLVLNVPLGERAFDGLRVW